MVALPVRRVTRPPGLVGQNNGQLAAQLLVDTTGLERGPVVRLTEPAERGWRAMCAAALAAGHVLKATSLNDSYRPYSVQESIFRARYQTTRIAGRPTKTWQGRTWWLKRGMATAAAPGTSNHGWGLAVDIGEESDGDAGTESISDATVRWLVVHAGDYGFSAELQEEPWHWRWYVGTRIPAAVLAYEAGTGSPQGEGDEEMASEDAMWLGGLINQANWKLDAEVARDAAMLAAINALTEAITAGGGSVDGAPIIAAIREEGAATRAAFESVLTRLAAALGPR